MGVVSVKYYLESKVKGDKKKLLPIFLYVRHRGHTIKVYTERKCHWHGWDVVKGEANPRKFTEAVELNDFLADLKTEVTNLYNYNLRKSVTTTSGDIRNKIGELTGEELKRINLIDFATDLVEKTKMAQTTRRGYVTTINTLQAYSDKKKKILDFNDIDLNFYDSFVNYMWKDKGFNDNTVGTRIKHLKAIMNQAFERDLHNNLNYKKKKFEVFRKDVDAIYLSEAEIDSLYALDLMDNEKLSKVRDIFFVGCWTGLRFSDLIRVTSDKFIQEDGMTIFKIETEKTGEIVKIPVSPKLIPILTRYGNNLPVISNQKLNDYLKDLGELAKIDQMVEISDSKAGEKHRETFPKYDLITTHTARRSFATNLYLKGVPTQSIMAITGHRTEKAFLIYLKLTNTQKIREIDKHFKKEHRKKKKQTEKRDELGKI